MRQVLSFKRRSDGASLIEFAIVAPIFLLLILSIIEFGLILFSMTTIESATNTVARQARVKFDAGSGNLVDTIRNEIRRRTNGLVDTNEILITTDLRSYNLIPRPEKCLTQQLVPPGTCPAGTPFEDANGDGIYNGTLPDLDLGGPGDLITINVHHPYRILIPFVAPIIGDNGSSTYLITATTYIKNEPQL